MVATTKTGADGRYEFTDLAPGDYVVEETNPPGLIDFRDHDTTPDGDVGDQDKTVDQEDSSPFLMDSSCSSFDESSLEGDDDHYHEEQVQLDTECNMFGSHL